MEKTVNMHGVFTALITPFKQQKIDERSFVKHVENQVKSGIQGLVPCGCTGEAATLSGAEKLELIKLCVQTSQKKALVFAGVGEPATDATVKMAIEAEKLGVDGLLVITPYSNRPTQEGLYRHFKAINDAVSVPIMLYSVPKRTGIDFTDDTIIRLSELKNIRSIKDAGGDDLRPARLIGKVQAPFYQFTGDDSSALSYNSSGGNGCVSVASNLVPELCVQLQQLWQNNDTKAAAVLLRKLLPLFYIMFCETSPGPVKYAAALLGKCTPEIRLPLVLPNAESKRRIKEVLESLQLITPGLMDEVITDQDVILY